MQGDSMVLNAKLGLEASRPPGARHAGAGRRHAGAAARLLQAVLLLAALLGGAQAQAQAQAAPDPASLPEATTRFMQTYMARWHMPGASIAVAKDGRLVYTAAFGYADLQGRRPPEPQTRFRIASVSKPITAIALFQLLEKRGNLDAQLDRPVFGPQGYLPEFTDIADPRVLRVRLRDLLQHTGGWYWPDGYDPQYDLIDIARAQGGTSPASHTDVIRYVLRTQRLGVDPGKAFHYSNFGYNLLGRVIEKLAAKPYAQVVSDMLLPLGIRDMEIAHGRLQHLLPDEARYYDGPDAQPVPDIYDGGATKTLQAYGGFDFNTMDAHGGWIATPTDLVRIALAVTPGHAGPQLLAPSTISVMTRPRPETGDPTAALGWVSRQAGADISHAGALESSTLSYLNRRADGVTWAVIFNHGPATGADVQGMASGLLQGMDAVFKHVRQWPAAIDGQSR
jgi:N-acyl-D-amino-acid deacylase